MGLFYDYQTAGKGVAKNRPKKKPFFKFWEIFAGKFWKLFAVNLIYFATSGMLCVLAGFMAASQTGNPYFLLFGIPFIIFFGPATAATMQIMRKFVLEKPIFLWDEYKKTFKANFRQALGMGIFDVVFFGAFIYGISFYMQVLDNDPSPGNYVLFIVTIAIACYFYMANFYIFLEIDSLTLPMGKIIKNALLLTIMGIKGNIITFVVSIAALTAVVMFLPYTTLVIPFLPFAWLMFLCAFISYPVIQKYIINPYYESKGERNPELPEEAEEGEAIFTDRGGSEEEIKKPAKPVKGSGKIIK
ncbi:MAG: DUF624 domain-containing protein [Firmicutes bacterium]|nr:DUF624 domain-containing protein [Bacillota bacterium]